VGSPSESLREWGLSEPALTIRGASTTIIGAAGELENPHSRANSRNFGRAMALKELTHGQRQFAGNFWLPESNTDSNTVLENRESFRFSGPLTKGKS
jgi:hypothetical protein